LVEELLLDDPAYLQWLSGQDWFRAKFAFLNQVIINRGSEPEETPDHNAMQVRFLDDEFCLRFMQCLEPGYAVGVRDQFNVVRQASLDWLAQRILSEKDRLREANAQGREWQIRGCGERLAYLCRVEERMPPALERVAFRVRREFEVRGVDVLLEVFAMVDFRGGDYCSGANWSWDYWHGCDLSADWHRSFSLELKPTVGDDYPAVLRQMKLNRSGVLFVGEYTGKGATEEQFVKTFATASIRVVFAREVGD
jgi:hypothetical protein